MQVWRGLDEVPTGWGPSVVTLGNFDGVHRGHAGVLAEMATDARAADLRSVAVTFTPHPAQVHRPQTAPPLLTGDADRLELLAACGLDAVLLEHYTLAFARQSPEEFVRRYLVEALGARVVVVGRDVRFGWQNSGDLATMRALGEGLGFVVDVVDDLVDEAPADPADGRRRLSSTWVRELLAAGDVAAAAALLGRPHRLRGLVVHGDARGRELGYPTANLAQDASGMVPADGVYAGRLRRVRRADGTAYDPAAPDVLLPAAVSIGTNPTFDGVQRRVEAYVLDRTDLDLYDEEVVVELVERLRPTLRFDGVEPLLAQMVRDVEQARALLDVPPSAARPGPYA
ncbi:bifunctional riboflavin kinase/FAD synthetase [Cellulomonas marina]|uniref:Riboflavin biosynthesis protein n=1 Tax=Cellulomonas marina TaxID=988821 RepID=A0A1I0VHX5_9CELL|nr:bifunctional riboflavin kinase/FAD synthetase [Cellulomonas marina]GIG27972.1 riboflavin biosynthesis protein [Cellulomonas marina]SFA75643.1 riboflavin kinase / FMN adenylyltransferase [Cellulomonas marina]